MLNRYSVNRINKISAGREVWCWGCGERYGQMIKNYSREFFVRCIGGLIDADEGLQGSLREVGDRKVCIHAPEVMLKDKEKRYLLIISSDAYELIYEKASVIFKELDIIYTVYPKVYGGIGILLGALFGKMPLKRQLLFYVGSNGSQPKENADEMVRFLQEEYRGKPYSLVYLTDYPCKVPDGIKQISVSEVQKRTNVFKVMKYYYFYSTSKYIFYESCGIEKIRSNQISIYLNHGTIPLKYVKDRLKQPGSLNYAVCPGPGCAGFYEEQYGIGKDKLIYLMPPRVSRIFADETQRVDKVFKTEGRQIILWLPTFRRLERGDKSERRDSKAENPLWELVSSGKMQSIDRILGAGEQKLIIKCHPRERDTLISDKSFANIIITADEEIEKAGIKTHHLMNRAEALISDYSGVTFEYMLLNRPLGYYIPDMEAYSRGFSVENPLSYMPGFKMRGVKDLEKFFAAVKSGKDEFSYQRRRLVHKLFGETDPKRGAEELIQFLDRGMDNERDH